MSLTWFATLCLASLSSDAPEPSQTRPACELNIQEPHLQNALEAMFGSGLVPPGAILDSGAAFGGEACFLASLSPNRTIYAVEPLRHNLKLLRGRYGQIPNLVTMHGGLGDPSKPMPKKATWNPDPKLGLPSKIQGIDELVASQWSAEKAWGFFHLDVEGAELDVIRGGERTIKRDRPVVTCELHVLSEPAFTRELMGFISALGYVTFVVPEICGGRHDCRNLINVPEELANSFRPILRAHAREVSATDIASEDAMRLAPRPHSKHARRTHPQGR